MPASAAGWHAASDLFACEQRDLFQRRGLQPLSPSDPKALHVGLLFHGGREIFLLGEAVDYRTVIEAVEHNDKIQLSEDAIEDGRVLVSSYVEHWTKFPRPRTKAVEKEFTGTLFKAGGKLGLFGRRTARLDDVSEYAESGWRLAIGEAKSTSSTARQVLEEYQLHGQTLMQTLVYRAAGEPLGPVSGHVFDIAEKKYRKSGGGIEKVVCSRTFVPLPNHALTWFAENLRLTFSRRTEDLMASAHRNLTACNRPYKSEFGLQSFACPFRELCRWGPNAAGEFVWTDPKTGKVSPAARAPRWVLQ